MTRRRIAGPALRAPARADITKALNKKELAMRQDVTFGSEESPGTGWLCKPAASAGQQPGQEQS